MVEKVTGNSVSVVVDGQTHSLQKAIEDGLIGNTAEFKGVVDVVNGFLDIPVVLDFSSKRSYKISMALLSGTLTTPADYVNSANPSMLIAEFVFSEGNIGRLRGQSSTYRLDGRLPGTVTYNNSTYQPEPPMAALRLTPSQSHTFHEASLEFTIESGDIPSPSYTPASTVLTMYGSMKSCLIHRALSTYTFEGEWSRDVISQLPDGIRFKIPTGSYRVTVVAE